MTETAVKADQRLQCSLCNKKIAAADRQNHMGKHILFSLRRLKDPFTGYQSWFPEYPCGFCGGPTTGDGSCTIGIASGKAASSCPSAYSFVVSRAATVSKSKPCTNVPIECPLCHVFHWKYNITRHMEEHHPAWKQQGLAAFIAKIDISLEEQHAMQIPD
ncbi:hypothetical protein BDZ89DRAFT_997333, partial [Hymenopellis radicata]